MIVVITHGCDGCRRTVVVFIVVAAVVVIVDDDVSLFVCR